MVVARVLVAVLVALVISTSAKQGTGHIKHLHVVLMNHLDVGFDGIDPIIGFAYNVVNKYFDIYYPLALSTAQEFQEQYPSGPYRSVYTTHPWLLAMYFACPFNTTWGANLHCPNASSIAALQAGIRVGAISWHAFPFNTEPELADPSLINFALTMSRDLDAQFGTSNSLTMSQRDVPGLTRGMIPILAMNGVKAVTVGVNGASAPPGVPSIFVWQDLASNTSVIGMYHPGGYGGINISDCIVLPNLDHALCIDFNGDNKGPKNFSSVLADLQQIQLEFPNAAIEVGTWDNWTSVVRHSSILRVLSAQGNSNALNLTVFTGEIGDTWIHGTQSDPLKMMTMREIMRLRTACIESGECDVTNSSMKRFDRLFVKVIEHTWGLDVKTFLADWVNWTNAELQEAMKDDNYQLMIQSWIEQRQFINSALQELAVGYPTFASQIQTALTSFNNISTPSTQGWAPVTKLGTVFTIGPYKIQFSPNGSIWYLLDMKHNMQWASAFNQLGAYLYQTYADVDQDVFLGEYLYCNYLTTCTWAQGDFGKPNMSLANPITSTTAPTLSQMWQMSQGNNTSVLLQMNMAEELVTYYGAPAEVWLQVDGTFGQSRLNLTFTLVNKTSTRLVEAHWVQFYPATESGSLAGWSLDKLGSEVDPLDILVNGSHHLHGILSGVYFNGSEQQISILSLDSGLVSVGGAPQSGYPSPYPTPFVLPSEPSFSFNLYNNIWGTNYIMWYPYLPQDASMRFRFALDFKT